MKIQKNYVDKYQYIKAWVKKWVPGTAFKGVDPITTYLAPSLVEWYRVFGYNSDSLVYQQDRILKPEQVSGDGFLKVFFTENQGVVSWGYDTRDESDDPVVYVVSDDNKRILQEAKSISDFCMQRMFYLIPFCLDDSLWGWGDKQLQNWLFSNYQELKFGKLQWPGWPSFLLGNESTVIYIEERPESYINIGSVDAEEFKKLTNKLLEFGFTNEKVF